MNSARTDLSVVVITRNEAENLRASLPPLAALSDDIVVVDSFSTDDTVVLCRQAGATVVQREWQGYSAAKNFGNGIARNNWILSIDADEVLSHELAESIKNLRLKEGEVYELDRITNYCGAWIRHSGWYPDWKIRIFNRKEAVWEGDYVHERLKLPPGTRTVRLRGKLYHYSYRTSQDHLDRTARYAELSAAEMHARGKRATPAKRFLSPLFRFIRTYVIKLGILDGRNGWIISLRNARMVRARYARLQALNMKGERNPEQRKRREGTEEGREPPARVAAANEQRKGTEGIERKERIEGKEGRERTEAAGKDREQSAGGKEKG